jgi:hypothetical protein
MSSLIAASLGANVNFGVFLLIAAFGLVFGYFTIRGSGIDNHPYDGRDGTPGSKLPDEFHQFADRQLHEADLRRAARERRAVRPPVQVQAQVQVPVADEMTVDDVNRRLAAEAQARKAARAEQHDAEATPRR